MSFEQNRNEFLTEKITFFDENGEKSPQNANDRKSRAANTNKTKTLCIYSIYIVTDEMSNVHCSLLYIRAYACLCIMGIDFSNRKYVNSERFFLLLLLPLLSCIVRTHSSTEIPIYFFIQSFSRFAISIIQFIDSIAAMDFCSSIFELWYVINSKSQVCKMFLFERNNFHSFAVALP